MSSIVLESQDEQINKKHLQYPNFEQASSKNTEDLLQKNHIQKLALTRFKSSLDEFKQKQKELESAKELYELKERELKDVYIKTLPYLDVIRDIPLNDKEDLKQWDDSVSSSFDVLKKYFIHKPLTIIKDKTIYVTREGLNILPEKYKNKILSGVTAVGGDYIPINHESFIKE
tara:strand:- start:5507 stop:6025 length:519 start_codon:yes stop_codon:yes gene_type:complete